MTEVKLNSFNNDWYKPGNYIKRLLWHIFSITFINSYLPVPNFLKILILKLFGAKIGKGFVIKPGVNIKYPWFLIVGDDVWLGEKAWIDNFVIVKIGNNVCISQEAMLLTGNHDFTLSTFEMIPKEINLKDGAWVGAKTVVCPGVTINKNAVLTVGSVATKDLEADGIYQGNPAKLLKNRIILK